MKQNEENKGEPYLPQGKVYDLKISEKKGTAKKSTETALLIQDDGIQGDIHRGDSKRQVSFFTFEGMQKLESTEIKGLCTERFWGNITTEGIQFSKLTAGTKLKIGETIIEITNKGKKCFIECELVQNGLNCTIPMETAFGKILKGGCIHIGDRIEVIKKD
jgi:Uncharacterized protein conserved in bacteria